MQNDNNDNNTNIIIPKNKELFNNYNDSINLLFNQGTNKPKEINFQREKRPDNNNQDPNLKNKNK